MVLKYDACMCRWPYVYEKKTMKRSVLIFGGILGTILAGNMVYTINRLYNEPDFRANDVIGYTAMVVVFSLTFFGIRNYRNNQLNGVISLGQAFKTGALTAFVGSSIYVIVGVVYYYVFIPDFLDVFIPHVMKVASEQGATAEELASKAKQMELLREMYKNPLFVILLSYMEVLPIGLVVAFISSLILKRKTVPAST
jgi:hypothetical protein